MPSIARRLQIIAVSILVALSVASLGQTGARSHLDAVLADGARYYGPLVDGLLAGEGRLEWPNGASYEGGVEELPRRFPQSRAADPGMGKRQRGALAAAVARQQGDPPPARPLARAAHRR
jgi:hypothetical protein